MITVVILNWMRPARVLENIAAYAQHPLVAQVICFNNGAALTLPAALAETATLISASKDLGLYSRFAAASLARTEAIFHTDDDLIVPPETLTKLHEAWRAAPDSCHGLQGRDVSNGYLAAERWGRVEMVLTRAVMCSRAVNNRALDNSRLFDDLAGQPHGNGEDIILSFSAMQVSRELNYAHQWDYEDYADCHGETPGPDAIGINKRWAGHYPHRERIVARCRELWPDLLKKPRRFAGVRFFN